MKKRPFIFEKRGAEAEEIKEVEEVEESQIMVIRSVVQDFKDCICGQWPSGIAMYVL